MSRLQQALHNDVQALSLVRDEVALQAHLLRADMRTRWLELEGRMDELKEHLQKAKVAAEEAKPEVLSAAKLLSDTLKTGYADLKNALKH